MSLGPLVSLLALNFALAPLDFFRLSSLRKFFMLPALMCTSLPPRDSTTLMGPSGLCDAEPTDGFENLFVRDFRASETLKLYWLGRAIV